MKNYGVDVIFVRVNKDPMKIKRLLEPALQKSFSLGTKIKPEDYVNRTYRSTSFLEFNENNKQVIFHQFENLQMQNKICSEKRFKKWLEETKKAKTIEKRREK